MINVGHCCDQCQFFLQKFLGAYRVGGQVFECRYIAQILQKMQFFPYVVIHLLFCFDSPVHQQISSAEQAYRDSQIKFTKNFFGGQHVLPLQLKQLSCDNDALIVDFMAEMFEVFSANLKPSLECCLLDASYPLLFDCFADLFVDAPMLSTVFACAIFGKLAVSAHEYCLSFTDIAALHLTTNTQLTQTQPKIKLNHFLPSLSIGSIIEQQMFALQDLMQAFNGRQSFAWEVLYSQMMLQGTALETESIRKLIQLYSIGMERLNQLQNSPGNYFKNKINDLMGEKRVIRCLNDKQTHHNQQKQNRILPHNQQLQTRKREMEIRLAYDIQNSNDKLSSIIQEEQARESKIQRMVHKILNSEQEKLFNKIRQRQRRIESSRTQRKDHILMTEVSNTLENSLNINCFHISTDIQDEIPNISK